MVLDEGLLIIVLASNVVVLYDGHGYNLILNIFFSSLYLTIISFGLHWHWFESFLSIHCRQPQYFLLLHSIGTMGNLTCKISFSWICRGDLSSSNEIACYNEILFNNNNVILGFSYLPNGPRYITQHSRVMYRGENWRCFPYTTSI